MDGVDHSVRWPTTARLARAVVALVLLAGLAVTQACATANSHVSRLELSNAAPSAEQLAERVLAELAAGNAEELASLVVTKDEFCSGVYPELRSSKVRNVTCDFVWEMAMLNHTSGFREVLGKHKGKRYSLVSLRFLAPAERYATFTVHKQPTVTVRDDEGREREYRLFGDVLEAEGQFKLFGFMIDY